MSIAARRPKRTRPAWRWTSLFGKRIWEYRERDAGPCLWCGLPTQWIHIGSRADFRLAVNVSAEHNVPFGWALGVRGMGRDGRVTCQNCRPTGAP